MINTHAINTVDAKNIVNGIALLLANNLSLPLNTVKTSANLRFPIFTVYLHQKIK